jgi:hypothetical protein
VSIIVADISPERIIIGADSLVLNSVNQSNTSSDKVFSCGKIHCGATGILNAFDEDTGAILFSVKAVIALSAQAGARVSDVVSSYERHMYDALGNFAQQSLNDAPLAFWKTVDNNRFNVCALIFGCDNGQMTAHYGFQHVTRQDTSGYEVRCHGFQVIDKTISMPLILGVPQNEAMAEYYLINSDWPSHAADQRVRFVVDAAIRKWPDLVGPPILCRTFKANGDSFYC